MKPSPSLSGRAGTTLVELIMVLTVSSIITMTGYKAYNFFNRSTAREKQKAELQQDIITVSSIIEKDIRMAGCGLPGNGVDAVLSDTSSDQLSLFINENRRETALADTANPQDRAVIIGDATDFRAGGWVCLSSSGTDTLYREIKRIGEANPGADTLELFQTVGSANPLYGGTKVFPASKITYTVASDSVFELKRLRNGKTLSLGRKLDSLHIVGKTFDGTPIAGGSLSDAQVMMIVLGGYVGTGQNRVFLADSTEINLRNGS